MESRYTNWKEIAMERSIMIARLEKENRELRERNENLYNAWIRVMDENYELKKRHGELEGMPDDAKRRIYKNITGKEYNG